MCIDATDPWPSSDLGEPLAIVVAHAAAVVDHPEANGEDLSIYPGRARGEHGISRSADFWVPPTGSNGGQSRLDGPLRKSEREGVLLHQCEHLRCAFLRDLQVTEAKLHLVHVLGGGGRRKWDGRTRERNCRGVKLDVRCRPGEVEAGGEEGDAVQHWLAGTCVRVLGADRLAPGVCGQKFSFSIEKFEREISRKPERRNRRNATGLRRALAHTCVHACVRTV
eukprot:scaffold88114_cov64-Phaeocystis_antarctica.AAC.2